MLTKRKDNDGEYTKDENKKEMETKWSDDVSWDSTLIMLSILSFNFNPNLIMNAKINNDKIIIKN